MRELIKIENHELLTKEYKGQRVVTFKDIDAVHERPEGTARKRFNDNKKHFIEGEDFFKVPFNECPWNGQSIFDVAGTIESDIGVDYSGFIYIAINPENEYIKIGRTTNEAKRRISSLNVGRVKKITEYEYFACKDTLKAEKNIHKIISNVRKSGEWFDIEIEKARKIIKDEIEKVDKNYDPSKRHRGGNRMELTLITEQGYLMLVKSFTDDLAWKVQRQLVKSYFRKTQEAFPKTIQGQIQLLAKGYLELEQKLEGIDKDLQDFKKDMPLLGVECQKITRAKNQKVVPLMGGKEASAYKNNSLRGKVYKDINNQLCREFDVDTYKAIKRNQVDTAVKIIENYQLPMVLQEQIDLANRQISFV